MCGYHSRKSLKQTLVKEDTSFGIVKEDIFGYVSTKGFDFFGGLAAEHIIITSHAFPTIEACKGHCDRLPLCKTGAFINHRGVGKCWLSAKKGTRERCHHHGKKCMGFYESADFTPNQPTRSPTSNAKTADNLIRSGLEQFMSLPTPVPTTISPTAMPTQAPSTIPTSQPTTLSPTPAPTNTPTLAPTPAPSTVPTAHPTGTACADHGDCSSLGVCRFGVCICKLGWYGHDCSSSQPVTAADNTILPPQTLKAISKVPQAVQQALKRVFECEQFRKVGLLTEHRQCELLLQTKTSPAATRHYLATHHNLQLLFWKDNLPMLQKVHIAALLRLDTTIATSTRVPTFVPTRVPTPVPSGHPTYKLTVSPTHTPSPVPTHAPSPHPTKIPNKAPTKAPLPPSSNPTRSPTKWPTKIPTTLLAKEEADALRAFLLVKAAQIGDGDRD